MSSKIINLYFHNKALLLGVAGLICLVIALLITQLSHSELDIKHLAIDLLAHIGGLLAIVGVLHWMFEHSMRKEMLDDISNVVLPNVRIRESGLSDCYIDSSEIDKQQGEKNRWKYAHQLIIGAHYPEHFLKGEVDVFAARCQAKCTTTILLLQPDGVGAKYLKDLDPEVPDIVERVERIKNFLHNSTHLPEGKEYINILLHNPILRYSFIATEEYIWVNFFTNSKGITHVPALKVENNSPLYQTFMADIERLIEQSQSMQ